jgi:hypothetical protein
MACHEVAALRLGMMKVIGIDDEASRQHEINEIGVENLKVPGPIRSMSEAQSLYALRRFFEASLVDHEQMVASTDANDSKLPYYRSLLVLTKKVEMELGNAISSFEKIYRDLDEIHDFVHEIYPAS